MSQDKDEKEILNKKIADVEKEISTLESKIYALKEREQLRRSARLKASPRVTGCKSPTPNDGCGGDPKRQRLQTKKIIGDKKHWIIIIIKLFFYIFIFYFSNYKYIISFLLPAFPASSHAFVHYCY